MTSLTETHTYFGTRLRVLDFHTFSRNRRWRGDGGQIDPSSRAEIAIACLAWQMPGMRGNGPMCLP